MWGFDDKSKSPRARASAVKRSVTTETNACAKSE